MDNKQLCEDGSCMGFDCKCINYGNCDTCQLLKNYSGYCGKVKGIEYEDKLFLIPQQSLIKFIKEDGSVCILDKK